MLKRSPGSTIYCALSSTIELLKGSLATGDSPAGRCCLYREMEQYDYQCEVSYFLPPALHYLWWQMAFSGGAYGARTQRHTIRSLCLRQVTLHWNTPPGMVMLSIPGVTLTPLLRWERTRWKSVTALSGRWICMALCVLPTIHTEYSYCSWPALGSDSTYVYIY